MTVAELASRMSARERTEWQLFFKIENEELEKQRQTESVKRGASQQARKAIRRY
jgi:hypothetical protein